MHVVGVLLKLKIGLKNSGAYELLFNVIKELTGCGYERKINICQAWCTQIAPKKYDRL
ncbi:hypothetical protein LJC71_11495 [Desulfosarcina sp. OttesenSCG-928-A07]|nr:hypothetical protein [Desulfosarcina sp. OttesenSCG-928-G17]MDL2330342.1 hypothetical protein [Desulfosarcina sp. OttesenSCG-928-A07]